MNVLDLIAEQDRQRNKERRFWRYLHLGCLGLLLLAFATPSFAQSWAGGAPVNQSWYPTGRASLSVTTTTDRVALTGAGPGSTANVCNTGTADGYAAIGTSTVTATVAASFIVRAGTCKPFQTKPFGSQLTHIAGITNSGSTTFAIEVGQGTAPLNDTASGGGGSGSAVTIADGADVTQGAQADSACTTDIATCTEIALFKRWLQRMTTLITNLGSPYQAGGALPLPSTAATDASVTRSQAAATASPPAVVTFTVPVDKNNVAADFSTPVSTLPGNGSGIVAITCASGNVANASAACTLSGAASKTTYITGFSMTAGGATAGGCVSATVVGIITGTQTFTFCTPTGAVLAATPLIVPLPTPIPASATNTAIVITLPALGTGNLNATVNAQGFQL